MNGLFSEVFIEMATENAANRAIKLAQINEDIKARLAAEHTKIHEEAAAAEAAADAAHAAAIAKIYEESEERIRRSDILFEKALAKHRVLHNGPDPGMSMEDALQQASANVNASFRKEPGALGGRRHKRTHKRMHKRMHKRIHKRTHKRTHRR